MRDYGKVHASFWSSDTIRSLSDDGRHLALYLLTSPHGTLAGVFHLPPGYVCEDMKWTPERVSEGFAELFRNGFSNRCETTNWVWINKHFEWNPPENPNQRKAAAKISRSIPARCAWKQEYMRLSWQFLGLESEPEPEPLPNPSETLSKPVAVAVAVTEHLLPAPKPAKEPRPGFDREAGQFTNIPPSLIESWANAYPALSVPQELSKAAAWLLANPKNRKTDIARFLNGWLARGQDKAPRVATQNTGGKFDGII